MNASIEAAKEVGLRYVSDDAPGIRRRRRGKAFAYTAPDGSALRESTQLARIRALAIPPAYEDVWICPQPNGHIQATGRDARGRKQYRYHAKWRAMRDESKYDRMLAFAAVLPKIRKRVETDLGLAGMPREKVLATVVRLLETTTIRVGNPEYARDNNSFGLTTMQGRHAIVKGDTITFRFRGKSGVRHALDLRDRRLANIIRRCQELPGQQLFEYLGADGDVRSVGSSDVNEYIRQISGGEFTAKDFRTWVGTVQCALFLADAGAASTPAERAAQATSAIKHVAARLGNTPTVCRKSYVHPQVLLAYLEDGTLGQTYAGTSSRGLLLQERRVVNFLKARSR